MIVRFALRQLAYKAILNRTFAGDRVRDSDINDLDVAVAGTPGPIILIYTDDNRRELTGKSLFDDNGTVTLVFILAIATAQQVPAENGNGTQPVMVFPETDDAREMAIDFLERQIICALADPTNPWAGLYRKLVLGYSKWESLRGASSEKGTRFAARYVSFSVRTLNEPEPGKPLEALPFWNDLVTAIKADPDPDFAPIGDTLRKMIEGKPLTDYQQAMQALGLPDLKSAEDLGVYQAPLNGVTTEAGAAPEVDVIQVDDEDRNTSRDVGP